MGVLLGEAHIWFVCCCGSTDVGFYVSVDSLLFSCMIKPIQVTLVVCNNLVVAAAGSFDAGHIQ